LLQAHKTRNKNYLSGCDRFDFQMAHVFISDCDRCYFRSVTSYFKYPDGSAIIMRNT